jgi:hypothetical protein
MAGVRKYPVIDGRKKCVKCGQAKPFTAELYTRDATAPGGLTAKCKQCRYEQKRKWEIEHPERNRESQRRYYAKTREEYLPRKQKWRAENRDKDRASSKRWISKNKDRHDAYQKEWASIPTNALAMSLRARMRRCLIGGRAVYRNMEAVLGYSVHDLIAHLESTFQDGMSWSNYKYAGWHVDHIRPVSSFKLISDNGSLNVDEIRKCWALSNLRAMWGKDNLIKSDRWTDQGSDGTEDRGTELKETSLFRLRKATKVPSHNKRSQRTTKRRR